MTKEEKYLAVVRRLEEPPLCHYGERAVIDPKNTLEFVCPLEHEVHRVSVEMLRYMFSCTNVTFF
jgi:hypothetical protein